jgi:hypothetical protein
MTVAVVFSAAWFALWLIPFRPTEETSLLRSTTPNVTRLAQNEHVGRVLRDPTLFALPSENGFSGHFPEQHIALNLSLEKTSDPVRFLPPPSFDPPQIDPDVLSGEEPRPTQALPKPNHTTYLNKLTSESGRLFLSPELQARSSGTLYIRSDLTNLPEVVRAWLQVRADGTVERVLLQTPVQNPTLLPELQKLRFEPASESTAGEISIRFTPGEKSL